MGGLGDGVVLFGRLLFRGGLVGGWWFGWICQFRVGLI